MFDAWIYPITQKSHKFALNKCVFRFFLNVSIVVESFKELGSLFHKVGAAFWNERPPDFVLFVSSTEGSLDLF